MRNYRKSTILVIGMLIYVTAMVAIFAWDKILLGDKEMILNAVVSYALVVVLFFLLRKKEQMRANREKDIQNK